MKTTSPQENSLGHHTGKRPWGQFTIISTAQNYKIKKIEVSPGQS